MFCKRRNKREVPAGKRCHVCIEAHRKYAASKPPGYFATKLRKFHSSRPGYVTAYFHKWKIANPLAYKEWNKSKNYQRRARNKNASGTCSYAQWIQRVSYYGWTCCYCRRPLVEGQTLTQDHKIPLSAGGTHWPSNLVPACRSCNASKRNKHFVDFKRSSVPGLIRTGLLSTQ